MSHNGTIADDTLGSRCGHTTYCKTYKRQDFNVLPPIKYSQPPAFELQNVKHVKVREFPVIPLGPHRRLHLEIAGPAKPALAPGFGSREVSTERFLDKKPILKTSDPRKGFYDSKITLFNKREKEREKAFSLQRLSLPITEEKLLSIDSKTLNSLIKELTWTTTTDRANKEAAISIPKMEAPRTTFEENADLVKLRPRRYDETANEWQKVAPAWDRLQSRPSTERWLNTQVDGSTPKGKQYIRKKSATKRININEKIQTLVQDKNLSRAFEHPCPGYAGFVPRSPVDVSEQKASVVPQFQTVMKASYKDLTPYYNNKAMKAHTGPLSQLVTLTYPYNPFNKVEKRAP